MNITIEDNIFSSLILLLSNEKISSFFCHLPTFPDFSTSLQHSLFIQELKKCAKNEQSITQCAHTLRKKNDIFWLPNLHPRLLDKLEGIYKQQYAQLFNISYGQQTFIQLGLKIIDSSHRPLNSLADAWNYTITNSITSVSEFILIIYGRNYSNTDSNIIHEVSCGGTLEINNKVYTVVGCIAYENHSFMTGNNITITYCRKSNVITKWKNRQKSEINDIEFQYYIKNAHALLFQFKEHLPISSEDNFFSSITLLFSIENVQKFFCNLPRNQYSDILQQLIECATMKQTTLQCAEALKKTKTDGTFINLTLKIDKLLHDGHRDKYKKMFEVVLSEISSKTKLQRNSMSQEDRTRVKSQVYIGIEIVDSSNQPINNFKEAWNYTFSKHRNPVRNITKISEFIVIQYERQYFSSNVHKHPIQCERTLQIEGQSYKVIGCLAYENHKLHKGNNIAITYSSKTGTYTKWKNKEKTIIKGEEYREYIQHAHIIILQAENRRVGHKVNI